MVYGSEGEISSFLFSHDLGLGCRERQVTNLCYSRFPNYFGESTLWTGLATVAAGALVSQPIQSAIGLSGGPGGLFAALSMAYISRKYCRLHAAKRLSFLNARQQPLGS